MVDFYDDGFELNMYVVTAGQEYVRGVLNMLRSLQQVFALNERVQRTRGCRG